jgi:hypothetical protein
MPGSKTKGVTDFFLLQTGPITIIELLPWSLKFFVHKHVPKNICLLSAFYGYFYFCLVSTQIQNLSICHVVNVTFMKIVININYNFTS